MDGADPLQHIAERDAKVVLDPVPGLQTHPQPSVAHRLLPQAKSPREENAVLSKGHVWDQAMETVCSQYGYCGKSQAYCGKGCNPLYGKCDGQSSSSKKPSSSAHATTNHQTSSSKRLSATSTVSSRSSKVSSKFSSKASSKSSRSKASSKSSSKTSSKSSSKVISTALSSIASSYASSSVDQSSSSFASSSISSSIATSTSAPSSVSASSDSSVQASSASSSIVPGSSSFSGSSTVSSTVASVSSSTASSSSASPSAGCFRDCQISGSVATFEDATCRPLLRGAPADDGKCIDDEPGQDIYCDPITGEKSRRTALCLIPSPLVSSSVASSTASSSISNSGVSSSIASSSETPSIASSSMLSSIASSSESPIASSSESLIASSSESLIASSSESSTASSSEMPSITSSSEMPSITSSSEMPSIASSSESLIASSSETPSIISSSASSSASPSVSPGPRFRLSQAPIGDGPAGEFTFSYPRTEGVILVFSGNPTNGEIFSLDSSGRLIETNGGLIAYTGAATTDYQIIFTSQSQIDANGYSPLQCTIDTGVLQCTSGAAKHNLVICDSLDGDYTVGILDDSSNPASCQGYGAATLLVNPTV